MSTTFKGSFCASLWTGCHLCEVCAAGSGTGQVVGLTTQWGGNHGIMLSWDPPILTK